MSANLRRFTRAVYAMDAVANRVDPSNWQADSPCDEWCAQEVLGHALTVVDMVASLAVGEEAQWQEPLDAVGDDPIAAWAAARDRVLEHLDRPDVLHAIRPSPFGEMPVDDFLGAIWVDTLTHSWDLATATGQPHAISADLAIEAEASLAALGDGIRGKGRFGPIVEGDFDDPVDSWIAIAGRDPSGR